MKRTKKKTAVPVPPEWEVIDLLALSTIRPALDDLCPKTGLLPDLNGLIASFAAFGPVRWLPRFEHANFYELELPLGRLPRTFSIRRTGRHWHRLDIGLPGALPAAREDDGDLPLVFRRESVPEPPPPSRVSHLARCGPCGGDDKTNDFRLDLHVTPTAAGAGGLLTVRVVTPKSSVATGRVVSLEREDLVRCHLFTDVADGFRCPYHRDRTEWSVRPD